MNSAAADFSERSFSVMREVGGSGGRFLAVRIATKLRPLPSSHQNTEGSVVVVVVVVVVSPF